MTCVDIYVVECILIKEKYFVLTKRESSLLCLCAVFIPQHSHEKCRKVCWRISHFLSKNAQHTIEPQMLLPLPRTKRKKCEGRRKIYPMLERDTTDWGGWKKTLWVPENHAFHFNKCFELYKNTEDGASLSQK